MPDSKNKESLYCYCTPQHTHLKKNVSDKSKEGKGERKELKNTRKQILAYSHQG